MNCACGNPNYHGGLCKSCRWAKFGQARRKYFYTPELHEKLRQIYAGGRGETGHGLEMLALETGYPSYALKSEAHRIGLQTCRQHRWTPEQDAYLREKIGIVSVTQIAKCLGRTVLAIEGRAAQFSLSLRPREGYNIQDLALAFGEHTGKIRRWMDRGLFGKVHNNGGRRVTEGNVVHFLRQHNREYTLRRIDEEWFKSLMFGYLANYGDQV